MRSGLWAARDGLRRCICDVRSNGISKLGSMACTLCKLICLIRRFQLGTHGRISQVPLLTNGRRMCLGWGLCAGPLRMGDAR